MENLLIFVGVAWEGWRLPAQTAHPTLISGDALWFQVTFGSLNEHVCAEIPLFSGRFLTPLPPWHPMPTTCSSEELSFSVYHSAMFRARKWHRYVAPAYYLTQMCWYLSISPLSSKSTMRKKIQPLVINNNTVHPPQEVESSSGIFPHPIGLTSS